MLEHQSVDSEPIVSVVMPCYNQGAYIDEAVESVLNQTFQDFEIVVVNDGSTDPFTIEHLKGFDQPKTRVIHTENGGVAAARNRGIQEAKGRYILPLDADDCITPTYLEKAVPILDTQPEVGIVYGQGELFGEKTGFWALPEYQFPEILLNNVIFNSALFRKCDWETVGGYRSNMVFGFEDYDFWLYLIELGRQIIQLPDIVLLYRQLSDSRDHSMQFEQRIACYVQLFRNHPKLYSENIDFLFRTYLTYQVKERDWFAQAGSLTTALQHTQNQLEHTQNHLKYTQNQLEYTQNHLKHTQNQLEYTQALLEQIQEQAITSEKTIAAMESSKFWRLRQAWMRIKKRLSPFNNG